MIEKHLGPRYINMSYKNIKCRGGGHSGDIFRGRPFQKAPWQPTIMKAVTLLLFVVGGPQVRGVRAQPKRTWTVEGPAWRRRSGCTGWCWQPHNLKDQLSNTHKNLWPSIMQFKKVASVLVLHVFPFQDLIFKLNQTRDFHITLTGLLLRSLSGSSSKLWSVFALFFHLLLHNLDSRFWT